MDYQSSWSDYLKQAQQRFQRQREQAMQAYTPSLSEHFVIKRHDPHYATLKRIAYHATSAFNTMIYHYRQSYFHHGRVNYTKMDRLCSRWRNRLSRYFPTVTYIDALYRSVRSAFQTFEQQQRTYQDDISSSQRPSLPRYRRKDRPGRIEISLDEIRIDDKGVRIPSLNNLYFKLYRPIESVQAVRIIPKFNAFVFEIVHQVQDEESYRPDNRRYLAIDPGLNNAFTLTSNVPHLRPIIINGKSLKAYNHNWNQRVQALRAEHARYHQKASSSNQMRRLQRKRYLKIESFGHAAGKYIVDYAVQHELHTIIIGENKSRRDIDYTKKQMGKDFMEIPYQSLLHKLIYKATLQGIVVMVVNEAYTSQTSFLDHERPIWDNGNTARSKNHLLPINRRVHRGLFRTNQYRSINSDVNGSLQILRKVVPDAFRDGIAGIGLYPIKHNVDY